MLKKLDRVYFSLRDGISRAHISRYNRKWIKKRCAGGNLSKEQRESAVAFFKPYAKVDPNFHEYYTKMYGEFFPEYLPNDLYMNYIDRFYNDGKKAVVLENKCYFAKMFPDMKQPDEVCYRLNGFWFAPDDGRISFEQVCETIANEQTIVVKQAIGSSGGHMVSFIDKDSAMVDNFKNKVAGIKEDIIVQRPVIQHPDLSRMNASSLNSLRVVSLLRETGVTVYSVVLRMGINGMRVDNASSGGINCGVTETGYLRPRAHAKSGAILYEHPDSRIVFEEFKVPSYEKVIEAVKNVHPLIPHFRLVSWDFAIGQDGEPVLIEANLNRGGIHINQVNNGPLFGKDTKLVLDEVFGVKS